MAKIIKNVSQSNGTWVGRTINSNSSYQLLVAEEIQWANDDLVISDISNGTLVVNNGVSDIVGINNQVNFLKDNIPTTVVTTGTRSSNGMRARLIGIGHITVLANQTADLDWSIPQLTYNGVNKVTYFDGIEIFAENASVGDTCSFQIVDVNNVLGYGAGAVLEEFGKDWGIIPNTPKEIKLYNAKLVAGLFLRLKYKNTHATNSVKFLCNIFRHLDQNS